MALPPTTAMRASRLVPIAVVVFAAALAVAAARSDVGAPPLPPGPSSIDYGAGEYVGSAACERCHDAIAASWRDSIHIQMTRPIAQARVIGDFSPGTHLEKYGRA